MLTKSLNYFFTLFALGFPLAASAQVLSSFGYGAIKFGEQLSSIETRLRQKAVDSPGVERDTGCGYVSFKKYPHISFMVEEGVVTRADAHDDQSVKNSANLRVGMSLGRVKRLHPKIQIKPHQYDENGHYLILESDDKKRAIVAEEIDGKAAEFRAGLNPSVGYVEGCL